jgi:hypothetical protein
MYKLLMNGEGEINTVFNRASNSYIPFDENNTDYRNYLAWVAEGNTPEPPDPRPEEPVVLSCLEFMGLFDPSEQQALVESVDPQVKLFTLAAAGASYISFADPIVAQGLEYLVQIGLLTEERKQQILAYKPSV